MNEQQRRGLLILPVIMMLVLFAALVYYRLVRDGKLPPPGRGVQIAILVLLLVVPLVALAAWRFLQRETEDARVLRERMEADAAEQRGKLDFQRMYPLVFRPEWRAPVMTSIWAIMTVLALVRKAIEVDIRIGLALAGGMVLLGGLYIWLRLARKLVVSWEGVYLHRLTRKQFWPWDQIVAVVLREHRGRMQPALRLWSLNGDGDLVSLGGIDFANEQLLFDALVDRVGRAQIDMDGRIIEIDTKTGKPVREIIEEVRPQQDQENLLTAILRGAQGPRTGPEPEPKTVPDKREEKRWAPWRGEEPENRDPDVHEPPADDAWLRSGRV